MFFFFFGFFFLCIYIFYFDWFGSFWAIPRYFFWVKRLNPCVLGLQENIKVMVSLGCPAMGAWIKCVQRFVLVIFTILWYPFFSLSFFLLSELSFDHHFWFQICDMVTVARYLNLTLVVPELDKTSFWADPRYIHCLLVWN